MRVESKKTYGFGFILRETDLRRLVDTIGEQFKKLAPSIEWRGRFRLKFKNGVIAEDLSLDDVLSQENYGPGMILRLSYEAESTSESALGNHTLFEFVNVDAEEGMELVSVRSAVIGQDRDWVFVTSSLLEERIERLRRFAPNQFAETRKGKLRLRLVALLLPLIVTVIWIALAQSTLKDATQSTSAIGEVEAKWKKGEIKDPVQVTFALERARTKRANRALSDLGAFKPVGVTLAALGCLVLVYLFLVRYYLVFNFCWGEYLEEFTRREAARRFWLIVIGVGFIVSLAASIIANRLQW